MADDQEWEKLPVDQKVSHKVYPFVIQQLVALSEVSGGVSESCSLFLSRQCFIRESKLTYSCIL